LVAEAAQISRSAVPQAPSLRGLANIRTRREPLFIPQLEICAGPAVD